MTTATLERAPARRLTSDSAPLSATVPTELSDLAAAHAYGQKAAATPGLSEWRWEDIAPLLRAGWASHHAAICPTPDRHDWRLSWPAVQEGWTLGHTRLPKEHVP